MRLYYFFSSLLYFFKNIFVTKHYNIIFYSPHHFNRGFKGENLYFKDILLLCRKNNLSFLYLEEPDIYSNQLRSNIAVPFDFIFYLIIFLRRLMGSEMPYVYSDQKIGNFLKNIFFRNITFDNYITISQSMLSLFNGINPHAKKFDLQHGTIHAKKKNYLFDGKVSDNLFYNNANLLLYGSSFRDILVKHDRDRFFINHTYVIGCSCFEKNNYKSSKPNNNVLVSLQFTHDHSLIENTEIANNLEKEIIKGSKFHFYLKSHPRFNNEVNLSRFLSFPNVSLISGNLKECFDKCSIHLTLYSTVAFEAGILGIPTYFMKLDSLSRDIFNTQYNYPFFNYELSDIFDNYLKCSSESIDWASHFYQPFSEKVFLQSINNG